MSVMFRRYLRLTSPFLRGDDVRALQIQLGNTPAHCDGIFGSATQKAVIDFQSVNRLTADGVVGPKTWAILFPNAAPAINPKMVAKNEGRNLSNLISRFESWHNRYPNGIKWRFTREGLEIEGRGHENSGGTPETVRRVCGDYTKELGHASEVTGVPVELLIATMCTEAFDSKMRTVDPAAARKEPGYISDEATPYRVSYGVMQTLISTARQAIAQLELATSINSSNINKDWLCNPANSILAGAAYIAEQFQTTQFDPPLVACAYNAGNVIYNDGAENRWKMRQYPIGKAEHLDRYIKWFNDCFRYFKTYGFPFTEGISFWRLLNPETNQIPLANTPIGSFVFPLRQRPALDYKSGAREFGARRSGGIRKHAGCDLKAPPGTEIFSMAPGKILRGPYPFYEGTFALELQHSDGMVIRYGEISSKAPAAIKEGTEVSQGQHIAFVGQLNSGDSMLHLEMYSGTASGPLTQPGTPYKRRKDLIDPTDRLDKAILLSSLSQQPEISNLEITDLSQAKAQRIASKWENVLLEIQTTGASAKTAKQDNLNPGLEASRAMAEADLSKVKRLTERFHSAASKFGLPAALLAAIASRESRCGAVLKNGWGDHEMAFGIMQVDKRHHQQTETTDPESLEHIEQAAGILCDNLEGVCEKHPDWSDAYVLKGAVAAYNSGLKNIRTIENMDEGTTGNDYSADVIARAQYYFGLQEFSEFTI